MLIMGNTIADNDVATSTNTRALNNYSDVTLSQDIKPMGTQLLLKAALLLAKMIATATDRFSNAGPSIATVTKICTNANAIIYMVVVIPETTFCIHTNNDNNIVVASIE